MSPQDGVGRDGEREKGEGGGALRCGLLSFDFLLILIFLLFIVFYFLSHFHKAVIAYRADRP